MYKILNLTHGSSSLAYCLFRLHKRDTISNILNIYLVLVRPKSVTLILLLVLVHFFELQFYIIDCWFVGHNSLSPFL